MALNPACTLPLKRPEDVLWARQETRRFAARCAFSGNDLARIEIIAAELASNIIRHGGGGEMCLELIPDGDRRGLRIEARDRGPGITDIAQALRANFSTAGSHGDGLSAIREFADHFEIQSRPGEGTQIRVEKWAR